MPLADCSESSAVLDDPAFEWIDPVGAVQQVAESRGLSEVASDAAIELGHSVVVVGQGDMASPFEVAEDLGERDGFGH